LAGIQCFFNYHQVTISLAIITALTLLLAAIMITYYSVSKSKSLL